MPKARASAEVKAAEASCISARTPNSALWLRVAGLQVGALGGISSAMVTALGRSLLCTCSSVYGVYDNNSTHFWCLEDSLC